jgi:Ca-activated chloride channel family protein
MFIGSGPLAFAAGFSSSPLSSGAQASSLQAVSTAKKEKLGRFPLKHTDVKADVSGFVASVTVNQQFHNPYNEKIEAIYTFPLPEDSAVNEMTMKIGSRTIKGSIRERQDARDIYDSAVMRGSVASLLDQERPNVFTQAVANIEPGENIDIEIKYVSTLKYDSGKFSFTFPTIVDTRFIPGLAAAGGSRLVGLGEPVPDSELLNAQHLSQGQRSGHDISIALRINSPVAIGDISSELHEVNIHREGPMQAQVYLQAADSIPNRDFVASWEMASGQMSSGYLTHGDRNGGFFSLVMFPPKRMETQNVTPKEMIFLIDCSGSQAGMPMLKAKEALRYILYHMNPKDTFQVIAFNQGESYSSIKPEIASPEMKQRALNFIDGLKARGGTWMAPVVEKACSLPAPANRLRIVTFMTDGKVGNDFQVIDMIKRHRGSSRWFAFGTGDSVNRFLIDKIAAEGGGEAEYVLSNSSSEEIGKRFYSRISSPVLTNLKVEFKGLEVKDVFPKEVADLWAQKPLVITGRYLKAGSAKAILTGFAGTKPYRQELTLAIPQAQPENAVLKSVWARAKVDRLMSENWSAMQFGIPNTELQEEITATAIKYHILSQFTSFVAVEDNAATADGVPRTDGPPSRTVRMPVESVTKAHSPIRRSGVHDAGPAKPKATAFGNHTSIWSSFVRDARDSSSEDTYHARSTIASLGSRGLSAAVPYASFSSRANAFSTHISAEKLQVSPGALGTSYGTAAHTVVRGSKISIPNKISEQSRSKVRLVKLFLKLNPDERLIAKLRKLGLEVTHIQERIIFGSIRSDLIPELSRLQGVIKVEELN